MIDGLTAKYPANGKTSWSKRILTDSRSQGYCQWYRTDRTIKRLGYFDNGRSDKERVHSGAKGKPYRKFINKCKKHKI